ncbi:DUF4174 domain-containing protein [Akkermansiaceae bacterium]|nr:DUF4174 domain-containing protein [Akkermansiaceae bacterium]
MGYIASILVFITSMACAGEQIADFQWNSRLLVLSGASGEAVARIAADEAGIRERDIKVFVLGGSGAKRFPVPEKLAGEFAERLDPDAGAPMVYLIGKDGRTTLRWPMGEFTLEKLYASIDIMPMRQREMRERGQGAGKPEAP